MRGGYCSSRRNADYSLLVTRYSRVLKAVLFAGVQSDPLDPFFCQKGPFQHFLFLTANFNVKPTIRPYILLPVRVYLPLH